MATANAVAESNPPLSNTTAFFFDTFMLPASYRMAAKQSIAGVRRQAQRDAGYAMPMCEISMGLIWLVAFVCEIYLSWHQYGGVFMKKVKVWVMVALVLCAAQVFAGPGFVSIKATKKTADVREGGNVTMGKNIQLEERDVLYEFDIRSMAAAPQELRVDWIVLVKTIKGKLRTAGQGEETITLKAGETKTVETAAITLREETGPKGNGFKGKIEGIGVRVTDASGALVGELYDPISSQKIVQDAFAGNVKKRKD